MRMRMPQAPVFRTFELLYGERFVALQHVEPKLVALALLTLYFLSGIYASLVEAKVVAWLRAASEGWAPPESTPAGDGSNGGRGRGGGCAWPRIPGYGTAGTPCGEASGVAMMAGGNTV